MLKSNCALLHAAMFDMTAQGEYRVRLFLGEKKTYKNVSCQQQFMCFDHRSRLGMLQSVNNNVLCPFYTSESNAKWPYVSVWDRESGRCLLCRAGDAITANLLTGLLCQELPEETAPLHMNLSGGQLEGSGFLTVCICANWGCCYTLWGEIMLRAMIFLLVPARQQDCGYYIWR